MTIQQAIQRLAATNLQSFLMVATVDSVDEKKRTIDCTTIDDETQYVDVNIQPVEEEEKGICFFPKVGSYVVLGFFDKNNAVVLIQSSDIDSAKINIAENMIEIKEKSITTNCGDSTIEIDDKNIVFNGGEHDGLVKVKELTDKINELLNTLKSISVALAPSGTFPFAPIFAAVTPIVKTQKSDIENPKIKH